MMFGIKDFSSLHNVEHHLKVISMLQKKPLSNHLNAFYNSFTLGNVGELILIDKRIC